MSSSRLLVFLAVVAACSGVPSSNPTPQSAGVVWPDEGPATWTARPTVPAITANDLRSRLYQLADDSMMGRRIGEVGNYKGTEYIAREFQRLGLRPAGDGGTYFQLLPYGRASFDAATASLRVGDMGLAQKNDWVPFAHSQATGTPSADFTNVPTVFAGRWGDTMTVLDPATFAGKAAVFIAAPGAAQLQAGARGRSAPVLPRCDSVPDRFGAQAAILVAERQRQDSIARQGTRPPTPGGNRETRVAALGARVVLLVALDAASQQSIDAAFNERNGMRPPSGAVTPGAAISSAVATRLFDRPVDQLSIGTVGQPVSGRWTYGWRPAPAEARNVIAVLPGADPARAGEYVLVSAHSDHVGTAAAGVDHDSLRAVNTVTRRQGANDPVCRPTADQQRRIDSLIAHARSMRPARRDSIFNGADDDGSGTVVMLEIAELFATERPARSIIFMAHQGEEAGLLGSRWFTDHPTIPLASIVAAHNMDMVGKGRADQVKFGGPASVQTLGARRLSREFGDIIDSVNATRAEVMAIDKSWDVTANPMNRFCRSDQVNYVRHDVPVTYFSTGYSQDYHQLTDEPRYVDYEHAARLGRFIHDVMWAIAQRKDRPAIVGRDPAYPSC
jgi:hypothetical protein